jgi:UDP-N-acetylglucosamine acyltransferase
MIHPTAIIDPTAELGPDTEVGAYAVIGPWTKLGKDCRVFPHACLGMEPQDLKYKGEKSWLVCGDRNVFREFCTLNRAVGEDGETVVGSDNLFMAYSHIGHDCRVGNRVKLANSVALAGHVEVGDEVFIGGLAGVHQFCRIGRHAMVGGGASISKDVIPFGLVSGDIPKAYGLNLVGLRRSGFSREDIRLLEQAAKLLFDGKLNTSQALEQMASLGASPHLSHLIEFVKTSQRGIHK